MQAFFPCSALLLLLLPISSGTLLLPAALSLPSHPRPKPKQGHHHHEYPRAAFISTGISTFGAIVQPVKPPAFALEQNVNTRPSAKVASSMTSDGGSSISSSTKNIIVYHPFSINVDGVQVPVAAWHPLSTDDDSSEGTQINRSKNSVSYEHRISVSKIGKLLAGWKLPSFLDRNFSLQPSSIGSNNNNVQIIASSSFSTDQQQKQLLPQSAPVILLAHGYLGSRFDLSHIGEALASQGFLVLSPEYPESLAASYDATSSATAIATGIPIDRTTITNTLLRHLANNDYWNVLRPTSYGILGHSLGCGTVDRTGDASWTRVCLAGGYPSLRGPNCLFVGSTNDGAVSVSRALGVLREYDFDSLDEGVVRSRSYGKLMRRSALIFGNNRDTENNANAPNHISFLMEGTNDAMVEFLSPLLPVARVLGIPVLDFDKYQVSRDSGITGEVVVPLVVDYFKQMMM